MLYENYNVLCYYRDSLLATLLDAVRGSGNMDVHVKMKATARGKRMGPFYVPMEEEVLWRFDLNSMVFVAYPGLKLVCKKQSSSLYVSFLFLFF